MRLLTMGWLLVIMAQIASGQEATAQQPKPRPEVQKLAYYLGRGKVRVRRMAVRSALRASFRAQRPANGSPEVFISCVGVRRKGLRGREHS